MLVVYQRSCGKSTCVGVQGSSRRLRGAHWGELAADFVAPQGWIPIDGLVRLQLDTILCSPEPRPVLARFGRMHMVLVVRTRAQGQMSWRPAPQIGDVAMGTWLTPLKCTAARCARTHCNTWTDISWVAYCRWRCESMHRCPCGQAARIHP